MITDLSANVENAILVRARAQVGAVTALANYRRARQLWFDYGHPRPLFPVDRQLLDHAIVARARWQALAEVLDGS